MIDKKKIDSILWGYDKKKITLATICSHSSLQIFHGARLEGIKTIGICRESVKPLYDAFPLAKPDEFIMLEDYSKISKIQDELVSKNAIIVPHGSFVEYTGEKLDDLPVPVFGNRNSLLWERDRAKMYDWMKRAGLRIPRVMMVDGIDAPSMVKFPGAKGGKGYLIVQDCEDFEKKVKAALKKGAIKQSDVDNAIVQEYIEGVRYYPHYFYSPISKKGYKAGDGMLEMLSMDKRIETNVDEIYRSLAVGLETTPSFGVSGNLPVIARESLVPKLLEMGKKTVEASIKLFGGIPGPFCIETICNEDFEFVSFEISARIVAGTNLYPLGSQYSAYIYGEPVSTGRRIAMEVKEAAKQKRLPEVVY